MSRDIFFQYTGAQSILALLGVSGATTKPIEDDEYVLGMVCTNQSRKDLPLALETCSTLARDRKLRVWLHLDKLEGSWSVPSLLIDFGLLEKTVISLGVITDQQLAVGFSACDITLGPGSEGFGLPIAESLACHTPVVTGSYAGAADFVPKKFMVSPVAFRYEGSYGCKRPVYHAEDWARKVDQILRTVPRSKVCLDPKYEWNVNWLAWEKYLREAAK
jgi:glycosyltransferase involved in cell wall biosynthesis